MKKFLTVFTGFTVMCLTVAGLQGCLKDTYTRTHTYTYFQPVYKTTQQVRDDIRSNTAQPVKSPGKIYVRGSFIFMNEIGRGIHVIDNSYPAQPQSIAFIDIPGNLDMAVKGNTLYADLYTDLVAIDISNPRQVVLKKVVENIFPERYYANFRPDRSMIIAAWERRDTTVTETFDVNEMRNSGRFLFAMDMTAGFENKSNAAAATPYGTGGSMARFTLASERLYTVGNQFLDVFNIVDAENPVKVGRKSLGWNIETIYPFMNKLFIGSQTGMFVYSIANPDDPVKEGEFNHVRTCDPVIADQKYAYVTLRSGTTCQGFTNQLDILDLSSISTPTLVKTYQMKNPHGLSKDGTTLFICDGTDGLKIYNAANPSSLQMIRQITGIEPYDVIAWSGHAIVVAKDGLYQYDYSNLNDIQLQSKINLAK